MIFVKTGAGLGNQLFHYAFARYVQSRTSKRVVLFSWDSFPRSFEYFEGMMRVILRGNKEDEDLLLGLKRPRAIRYPGLHHFAISLELMPALRSWFLIRSLMLLRFLPFSFQFISHPTTNHEPPLNMASLLSDRGVFIFHGEWWNGTIVNQIRDLLVDDLQFVSVPSTRSQELATEIRATPNAVALHLRCGWGDGGSDVDDTGQKRDTGLYAFRSLSADYYAQAIPLVERKLHRPTFFVFADDLKKAKALGWSAATQRVCLYRSSRPHALGRFVFNATVPALCFI